MISRVPTGERRFFINFRPRIDPDPLDPGWPHPVLCTRNIRAVRFAVSRFRDRVNMERHVKSMKKGRFFHLHIFRKMPKTVLLIVFPICEVKSLWKKSLLGLKFHEKHPFLVPFLTRVNMERHVKSSFLTKIEKIDQNRPFWAGSKMCKKCEKVRFLPLFCLFQG